MKFVPLPKSEWIFKAWGRFSVFLFLFFIFWFFSFCFPFFIFGFIPMVSFFPYEDFFIFDKKESLIWARPLSGYSASIEKALRLSRMEQISTALPEGKTEGTWVFPKKFLMETPIPGDWLVDFSGTRWTISEVQDLSSRGCWKCLAVNLLKRFGLCNVVDIYRPQWELDKSGVPIPQYRLSRPRVPARILPVGTDSNIEIHFSDPELAIFKHDRLETPKNRVFQALEFQPATVWTEVSKVFCQEVYS